MARPGLTTRTDLASAAELRRLARRESRQRTMQRLLVVANALEGMSRVETARAAGMERQALRYAAWLSGLMDRPHGHRREVLNEGEQAVLVHRILQGS